MPAKPILFYDGECPLCRREIDHYRKVDKQSRIDWQDIFASDTTLAQYQLSHTDAMKVIHAVDSAGTLQSGAHAFVVVWQELPGYRHLNRAYLVFARLRFRSRCKQGCQLPPR
jgi:predicted DCC family thiol-disulfide oxidoreductase YuxK